MIHRFEVDGVPALHAPRPGRTTAGLVFRVGSADETLARAASPTSSNTSPCTAAASRCTASTAPPGSCTRTSCWRATTRRSGPSCRASANR
ncbi:hypothetical protein ACFQ1I_16135 [Kitasatospora arboriphila]